MLNTPPICDCIEVPPETPKVPNCLPYYIYFWFGPWTPLEQLRVHFFQTTVTSSLYTYVRTLGDSGDF